MNAKKLITITLAVALTLCPLTFGASGIIAPSDVNINKMGRYSMTSTEWRDQLLEILKGMNFTNADTTILDGYKLQFGTSNNWSILYSAVNADLEITGNKLLVQTAKGKAMTFNNADTTDAASDLILTFNNASLNGAGDLTFGGVAKAGSGAVQITNATGNLDGAQLIAASVATAGIAASAVTDAKINIETKLSPNTATKLNFKDFGVLTATATYDPAATTDVCTESAGITVTGAAVGDMVLVYPLTLNPTGNVWWEGRVSALNTVIIKVCSHGAVDLASDTWNIAVIPF